MAGIAWACLAAAGCSSSSTDSNPFAQASSVFTRDSTTFVGRAKGTQVVTADDLISAEGNCASGPAVVPSAVPEPQPQPEAGATDGTVGQGRRATPAAPENSDALLRPALGIALGMTECEVARRAGAPERVEVGADERGERAVVLSYTRGERAGIYRFREGRLFTIERVAAVEEPKKPVKKPAAKPAARQAAKPAAAKPAADWPAAPAQQQPPAQASPQVWPSAPPLRSGQPSG